MRTRKSLGSGALISIATRRTWRRSMARNMPLSACARLRKRANCKARSANAWLNNAEVEYTEGRTIIGAQKRTPPRAGEPRTGSGVAVLTPHERPPAVARDTQAADPR